MLNKPDFRQWPWQIYQLLLIREQVKVNHLKTKIDVHLYYHTSIHETNLSVKSNNNKHHEEDDGPNRSKWQQRDSFWIDNKSKTRTWITNNNYYYCVPFAYGISIFRKSKNQKDTGLNCHFPTWGYNFRDGKTSIGGHKTNNREDHKSSKKAGTTVDQGDHHRISEKL